MFKLHEATSPALDPLCLFSVRNIIGTTVTLAGKLFGWELLIYLDFVPIQSCSGICFSFPFWPPKEQDILSLYLAAKIQVCSFCVSLETAGDVINSLNGWGRCYALCSHESLEENSMLAPCPAASSIHLLCLSSSISGSIQSSPEASIPLSNGSGSQKNYFCCLSLECFVSSVCWELFSKQGLCLKWYSEFLFVTKVAVSLLRTGSELFCHSALLWTATPELLWGATPTAEVGNWLLVSPGHSAHCCVRMHLGNGGTKRAGITFWCLSWRMTSRKCAYFQHNP